MSLCINPYAHKQVRHCYGAWGVGYVIDQIGKDFVKVAFPVDQMPERYRDKPIHHVRLLRRSSVSFIQKQQ